jgi:hypothetical protein
VEFVAVFGVDEQEESLVGDEDEDESLYGFVE